MGFPKTNVRVVLVSQRVGGETVPPSARDSLTGEQDEGHNRKEIEMF